MHESSSRDLELLLLAVQQGVLSNSQVEECLKDWEARRGGAPLPSLAVQKGFITEQKLSEITHVKTPSRLQVVMACRDCKEPKTLLLEDAVKSPRCAKCSGVLRFEKQAPAGPPQSYRGPVPDDVREAMKDPKSRFAKYVLLAKL